MLYGARMAKAVYLHIFCIVMLRRQGRCCVSPTSKAEDVPNVLGVQASHSIVVY